MSTIENLVLLEHYVTSAANMAKCIKKHTIDKDGAGRVLGKFGFELKEPFTKEVLVAELTRALELANNMENDVGGEE